jgi:GT2 family glycosyltransferase
MVVDNGSADGTVEWLHAGFPAIRVLALDGNLGFGEANRRGVAAASAPLVAFLNSDTVVEPGWLGELVRALAADTTIGAACSTLRLLDRPELINARGGGMTRLGYGFDRDYLVPAEPSPLAPEPAQREVLFPTAAAMLMRRRDFLDLGGFDPAMFMYHEDVDLGWRIWLSGRRVVVCRDSIVLHAHGGSATVARGRRWKDRLGARHLLRSLLVNGSAPLLGRALPGLCRAWLRNRAARQALSALMWNLVRLPGTLRRRRRVQGSRALSDADLAARGLVTPEPLPPAPPEAPRRRLGFDDVQLLHTPRLLPGTHSALGRLGPGWHPRERTTDGWWRWTAGDASCRLQVAAGAAGRLLVTAMAPSTSPQQGTVVVRCNDAETRAELRAGAWHELSLAVTADPDGRLDIRIASATAVLDRATRAGNPRRVGCAVREVLFLPATPPAPAAYATVSVIVPTYNRWPILHETLEALAAQTCRSFEAIVVDDGSTDGTWERLLAWKRANAGRLRLTPLRQENLKPGRARNLGLRHATADLALFIGDDIVPGPDLVAEHLAGHNAAGEEIAVLGFTDWHRDHMRVTPFLELINRDGQQFSYGHFAAGEDVYFTCFYTSNISLPRRVLGDDPFHPAFTFVDWEDVELGYRLSLRGLRIVYRPAAAARHAHPMTMADFCRRQEHVGRTLDVLLELHPELADDDAMPPPAPAPWFPLARYPVRAALPALSRWDRLGLPLPRRVYRGVLLTAFFAGRAQGYHPPSPAHRSEPASVESAPP